MPDPHDTLSIFAEVSIALVGFSGIAIAIGHRPLGSLTPLESRRLFNLFTFPGLVLFLSLAAIALLHFGYLDEPVLWRSGSAILMVIGVPWLVLDWRKILRLDASERAQVNGYVVYPFTALALITLALQLGNVMWWAEAWIFFMAMVMQLLFAFQQFVSLVITGLRRA
ncbi:MAG: hypothetical protein HKN58_00265 [Xanthomonadales bacterium]|nr:hypothetical protein [Xanthomonadales bacterium]